MNSKEKIIMLENFEYLKVAATSPTETMFVGKCGNLHKVNTQGKFEEIEYGEFLKCKCPCGSTKCKETNLIFVGTGNGCEEDEDKDVVWVFEEGSDGITYIIKKDFLEELQSGRITRVARA